MEHNSARRKPDGKRPEPKGRVAKDATKSPNQKTKKTLRLREYVVFVSERDSNGLYYIPTFMAAEYGHPEYSKVHGVYNKLHTSEGTEMSFGPTHERCTLVKHSGNYEYQDELGELQKFEGLFYTLKKYDGTEHSVVISDFFDYIKLQPAPPEVEVLNS
jgi:hypothetical protein